MRSRGEIQDQYKFVTVPAGQEAIYKLMFEILLDMRDILSYMRDDLMLSNIEKARVEQETLRQKTIREKYSDAI